jgi:hypothetical protein
MASYDEELLEAAHRLLARRRGQRGRLAGARVRRSVSTTYYALFHFLLEEVSTRIAGTGNDLRIRRRVLARTITHKGLRTALDKVRGAQVNQSVEIFFQLGAAGQPIFPPSFAQNLARAFIDAQTKRESADYDLNEPLSETDARVLRIRVRRVIRSWRAATTKVDRDFKHALAILILLKGQLRQDA